ncbi:MAG: hypothetical protein WEC59_03880 [Salibacteraceae bacterium]
MRKIFVLTTLLIFSGSFSLEAQDCNNFHKRKCYGSDNAYMNYNSQSKSGMFVLGHTSDLVFVAHSGQDYRISLCQDKKVEEPLKFQVLDGRSEEVLFDNQDAALDLPEPAEGEEPGGLPQFFEFSADGTKKIIIRITAPGPPPEEGNGNKRGRQPEPDPDDLFCVGVLLENMPSPKLGF